MEYNYNYENTMLHNSSYRSTNIEGKASDSWSIPSDIIFAPPNHGLLSMIELPIVRRYMLR